MISSRIKFSIAFECLPSPVEDAWQTIVSFLNGSKCLPRQFSMSQIAGHPNKIQSERFLFLDSEGVRKTIIDRDLKGFRVNTGFSSRSIDIWLAEIESSEKAARLTVHLGEKTKAPPIWNGLIEAFLIQWPCIGSWQWRTNYWCWQNHCVTDGYERFWGDVPPDAVRFMKPSLSGIGPDRECIDISTNPGRTKTIIPGIDFHPSSEMWLGPHFWQYAKCTKEEALAAGFWLEARDTPHFTYFKCWPTAFTRPDGDQGRMQQRLWKLFFHEDCEWPPGSGTICDEPMYGPPELMPGHQVSNGE
jgi:hypothetical protein